MRRVRASDRHCRNCSPCWAWRGRRDRRGYGVIDIYGTHKGAHRIAYELFNGYIPCGPRHPTHIAHGCNNPPCVNPSHLFAVPYHQNPRGSPRRCPLPLMPLDYADMAKRFRGKEEDIRLIFTGLWQKFYSDCWICGRRGRYRYDEYLVNYPIYAGHACYYAYPVACGVCHRLIRLKSWDLLNTRYWDAKEKNKPMIFPGWAQHSRDARAAIRQSFEEGSVWHLSKDPWLQFK
jgi:hypothetical protein